MTSTEAQAGYRQLALVTFPEDLKVGLNLGFYRTFAVPSIAQVLAQTGKMSTQPHSRAKATGTLMYTLISHGVDSPAGTDAVSTLTRLHTHLPVGEEEFIYVLAAFCVAPMHWIDKHGWRPTTTAETNASYGFYACLADRMGLTGLPGSYSGLAHWMEAFEREHFAPTPQASLLWQATRGMLASRVPTVLGPFAATAVDGLLDERLRRAVGARRPAAPIRGATSVALRLRARRMKRRH